MSSTVAEPDFGPEIQESSETETETSFSLKSALTLSAVGVAGRVALQGVPSIETLLPVTIAAGFYLGSKEGFVTGTSGFIASNFLIWGGQGPWTIFQALGAGAAGFAGGKFSKLSEGRIAFISSLVFGTVLFEVAVNAGSILYQPWTWTAAAPYLLAALPFAMIHLASTLGFGVISHGFRKQIKSI